MNNVIIEKRQVYNYPKDVPFRPSIMYPEASTNEISCQDNMVYDMVRECLHRAGYDKENFGTVQWNPLGHLIVPGDTVLLKPNLVMDINRSGEGEECLYTQPAVVAAVLDYVYIALRGKGNIIVGDAPMQECKFDKLIKDSGYDKLIEWCNEHYKGVSVRLVDFRGIHSTVIDGIHYYEEGEQSGIIVNLGEDSEFSGMDDYQENNIRITNYDPELLKKHHNKDKHEYFVSKYVLNADVIINMPKPKTHRKAGVTIAMKNLVGINTRKEYLPHHTNGSVVEGGDEYLNRSCIKKQRSKCLDHTNHEAQTKQNIVLSKFWRFGVKVWSYASKIFAKDNYAEGSWYGNNTISRTILDLNKILFYADKNGNMKNSKQRKYLIVADMIISGEKEGPVMPSPKNVGIIAMGENPISFDRIIGTIMGAEIEKIPTLSQLKSSKHKYVIDYDENATILSNEDKWNLKSQAMLKDSDLLHFIPTSGWKEVFKC